MLSVACCRLHVVCYTLSVARCRLHAVRCRPTLTLLRQLCHALALANEQRQLTPQVSARPIAGNMPRLRQTTRMQRGAWPPLLRQTDDV
jgi:hypothetical protein